MFKTLYSRLVLTQFILFTVIGGIFVTSILYSAHMYQQEVCQRLNRNLASYIARERVLIENGVINQKNLDELFQQAMIINPGLELYLLDNNGRILSYSSHLKGVKRSHVSLAPINQFISAPTDATITGDDPRSTFLQSVFSAAPITSGGRQQGYIYAILTGEQFNNISRMLKDSYIMQWSASTILVAMLFAFVSAMMVFFLLTRKLRILGSVMHSFKSTDFNELPSFTLDIHNPVDEIDYMSITFQAMAKRIYNQLNQLKETDALRRELVANVSHDLRTPLASLTGYLDTLLLKDETLSDEDRRKYLKIAQTNTHRLSKLVIELFELAKLDADEFKPSRESFSIAELVYDVAQKFELRASDKDISIQVTAPGDIPFVYADVGMIERVLDNLIDNALQHTPAQGTIEIRLRHVDNQVTVTVHDSGRGIDEKDLPHIFTRFYRKSTGESGTGSGAGLGLAIAHRIVELHGSNLFVKSAPELGTVFDFKLPTQAAA